VHENRFEDQREDGFTLIELLIICVVLPIVVGAIAAGLLSVFSLQSSVASRIGDSGDAQIVSANFVQDVQSAQQMTTSSSTTQCGTGNQLLGLEWSLGPQSSTYQTVVSYVEIRTGSTYSLVRQYCASGASLTPTTSTTVSYDIPNTQPSPRLTPNLDNTAARSSWVAAQSVTGVNFVLTEPESNYTYTLDAVPDASLPAGELGSTSTTKPTTSCGFATAGTGTYASTLCFVDFTSYNQTMVTSGGENFAAAVTGTPFTMTFTMTETGGALAGASFPTYTNVPTSEAFLGNNGFYTGVPNLPALYQTTTATTSVVTISNIQVLDSQGNPATDWELVTGDAESTDSGESIAWTSDQDLNLIPNSPTSPVGNACNSVPPTTNSTYLTGLGTQAVKCSATLSSDKTGTVMLDALTPKTLTVTLVGAGLQAMFLGLLLP
jgi:Tfp pilus assembly protein PilE